MLQALLKKIDISNVEEKIKEFIYSIGSSFETQIQSYKGKIIEAFKNYPVATKLKDYNPIVRGLKSLMRIKNM